MSGFQPGSAAAPCSKVEVSVACRNLRDKDAFSKSDPVCVLFTYDIKTRQYHEFGRTEMIKDNLNPDFVKKFIMNYYFEESQKLKFEIYDVDSAQSALSAHDFLGRIECTLGEIVGCGSGRIERQLGGIQGKAFITVRVEEVSASKEVVTMHLRASGLDKKDFLGKSDPFLLFYRANTDGTYTVVHKTEVIKNTLNPTWKPFSIPAGTLCNGDHERLIKVECFDWDSDGSSHDLIGEFTTKLRDLIKAPQANTTFDVINPKKKAKKRNYKNSGELQVMTCNVEIVPTFLDFLHGGLELNFTVAIDFTASNGNPSTPSSLHYNNPHQLNQYASAIQAVGEIIQDYDSDKLFPVLGFGAKLPDGSVSHEFPCNFNPNNPYCAGLQGIMQAYYTAIQRVQLYGPTNFSPIINHVSRFAGAKRDGSTYFILLIITDGVISDMEHTINAIIDASRLPMSLIIVGVGNAEFDAMDVLDADGQRLGIGRRYAERDIVQFVPFRNFFGQSNMGLSQAALAKAVLAEVPDQVLYYMKKMGVKPKPAAAHKPAAAPGPPTQAGPPGGVGGQQGYPGGGQSGPAPGAPPPGQAGPPGGVGGQPGYPGGGQPGYPGGGQSGPAPGAGAPPYPQGGPTPGAPPPGSGAPPYPQGGPIPAPRSGSGAPPYPQGGPTPAPRPGSGAPPTGSGAPPYPQGGGVPAFQQTGQPGAPQGGGGQAPYPQGGAAPASAPYPQGQSGQPPYPQGQPGGGSTPYPQGQPGGGSAPYPQGQPGGGSAPYPQGQPGGGSAPYPQGQPGGGSAPYPQGQPGGGSAPYPQGQPGGGSAPYPQGQQGAGGSAPYPQGQPPYPGQGQQGAAGGTPYPTGQPPYPGQGQPGGGSAPYPQPGQSGAAYGAPPYPQGQGQAPYPGQGQTNSQSRAPPGRPPPPRNTTI